MGSSLPSVLGIHPSSHGSSLGYGPPSGRYGRVESSMRERGKTAQSPASDTSKCSPVALASMPNAFP
eukprot:3645433-Lingulodinium_polyedra.AAC.1